jgi:AraC-like DNA-binding protein
MEMANARDDIDASLSRLTVGDLTLVMLRYGAEVAIRPAASSGFLMLQFVLSGKIEVEHDGLLTESRAGQGLIIESLDNRSLRWSADCEQLIIPVRRSIVSRAVEAVTGLPSPSRYGFDECFDLDTPAGQSLVALARYLLLCPAEISGPASPTGALLADLLAHHLVLNHRGPLVAKPQTTVAPYHVIRAEKFMRLKFAEHIGLNEIAAHAGVSTRTLSAAFRRFRNTSPMEWLRNFRLDQVRTSLQSGTAPTVAYTAARSGFAHPGRFSEIYRARFGESPNVTLAAARRG